MKSFYSYINESFDISDIAKKIQQYYDKKSLSLSKEDQIKVKKVLQIMKSGTKISLDTLRLYIIKKLNLETKKEVSDFNVWWNSYIKDIYRRL